ncbi:MAG TPA: metalloregulator ArsR/SmtB family transcription factor [Gemmatimonadaceae bacterium]|nr:metalloregulator ArsR/SmtB family transcription factor [Gemmatimonadaceae bacterium]
MIAQSVADTAALLGDVTRARMLLALIDHIELRASDLARHAGISAQTTSFHLAKLCEAHILTVAKRGRNRVYSLSGPHVAAALEALLCVIPNAERPARDLKSIELARTCYDHIAGRVGVLLADALVREGWLETGERDFRVTPAGEAGFRTFGIDVPALRRRRRQLARRCLDWTERRYHLAGSLGAALCDALFTRKWIVPLRSTRVVHVTPDGYRGLRKTFRVEL